MNKIEKHIRNRKIKQVWIADKMNKSRQTINNQVKCKHFWQTADDLKLFLKLIKAKFEEVY